MWSLVVIFCCITVSTASYDNKPFVVYNVMDYGAHGDGKTLDTNAIKGAIGAAHNGGGGTVFFPAGKYLTGPFNLTSNMVLSLDPKATILAAQDMTLYGIIPAFPSYGVGRDVGPDNYEPVVGGYHLQNVVITGGVIDGQGSYWWDLKHANKLNHSRPALVQLQYTTGLTVKSITLQNSPFWTLHPLYCDDVYIADVEILAPKNSPNTDGIDPDSSSNVLVERVHIANGDDMIAVKSGFNMPGILFNRPSENIIIRDSVFENGHGISIGSETSGGVRNVTFENIVVMNAVVGPHLKTSRGRGGIIELITYRNITVTGCTNDVIDLGMNYDHVAKPGNKTTTPIVRNVNFFQITAECSNPGKFECLPESPCTGFVMDTVTVKTTKDFSCTDISGTSKSVSPPSCFASPV
eukprot:TRINITY_DN18245_c0_g1_i1.p1 TRINITY_DN18245_c0_g1~~TRINITY_DN18245_c0_g1_i1.p1  ORF type:complete len:408 (-),score=52.91 TRINITY_DN18245_c0_g1_i1:40-1263(-)